MPLTATVVVLAVLASYLRGGRVSRIADAELSWSPLLFTGLALQLGVDAASARGWLGGAGGYALLLVSQLLVLGWVACNRYRPGMLLVFLGLAMNAAVIAANGSMPVDPAAIAALDVGDVAVPPGKHELMTEATRLPYLADIWPLPPLKTIISIGDVVLAAGLVALVHDLMSARPAAERRGGLREQPAGTVNR